MSVLRLARPLLPWRHRVFGLLLLVSLCTGTLKRAAAEEPVDTRTKQVWANGAETRVVDLTDLTAKARSLVARQLRLAGFKHVRTRVERTYADGRVAVQIAPAVRPNSTTLPAAPRQPAEPKPKPEAGDMGLREDIRRLVEGHGRLPEGYVPHAGRREGAKAEPSAVNLDGLAPGIGRILLRALEVRADPLRGPLYAGLLKEVGAGLRDLGRAGAAGLRTRILRYLSRPGASPEVAGVLQEMRLALLPPKSTPQGATPPVPAPPRPGPRLGGARLRVAPPADGGGGVQLEFVSVPPGSRAEQMGLRVGDRLLQVDGLPPTPARLLAVAKVVAAGGKLRLRVLRRGGETERLEFPPESRRK